MKAYSDNEDLALLSGIDPKKIVMITWIIAGILATIGGALYGLDKSFKPFTYFNNMLPYICCSNCWRDREIHLEPFWEDMLLHFLKFS
jgi:branched-subunit amino acid ABC-type transport system permease component